MPFNPFSTVPSIFLGIDVFDLEKELAGIYRGFPLHQLFKRHRRPAAGVDGHRHQAGRRGHHDPLHLHRHGRDDRTARGHTGLRRYRCTDLQHRRLHDRSEDNPKDKGDRPSQFVWPAGRLRRDQPTGGQARPGSHRGRRPELRGGIQREEKLQPQPHRLHQFLPIQAARVLW